MKEVNWAREESDWGGPAKEATSGVRINPCQREPGRWLQAEGDESVGLGRASSGVREGPCGQSKGGRARRGVPAGREKALTESHRKPLRGFKPKRDMI